ncbi:MAG TPA: hypothetical protein VK565_01215 [Gemmatimonadaceae bacterium]|nr:hypothetical protein [Gemmatimonadaceae bacterium]HMH85107.1 hypothetical protein [Gemmatimonadaceae bacterium]
MIRKPYFVATALLTISFASRSEAQGALSLQGLGYPAGGLSARAEGTGGGVADFDALSSVSPAALAGVGSSALFLQYSPEFRRVTTPSGSANTTTARFPLIEGVLPVGQSWTLGLSSSTFLDRSSETNLKRTQVVGAPTDTVTLTERNKVLGAIDDLRLALAWSTSPVFRIGVGAHVFAGSNRITFSQLFPDSAEFISSAQAGRISYAGFAGSLGVEWHPSRVIGFALSGRKGGDLRAQSGDTAIGSGRLPDHYSGSVTFDGIPGVIVSARAAHDNWSSLNSLSSSGIQAFDGWDTGAGVEASGPRILQRIITLRAGARFRTLPFGFNGQKVSEKTFAAGFGAPLTRDRAAVDVAIQRASRSAGSDISERGFILSIGLRVSP